MKIHKDEELERIIREFVPHEASYCVEGLASAILSAGYVKRDKIGIDEIFIKHIQAHLQPGQEVVCKICGKTANSIIKIEGKQ